MISGGSFISAQLKFLTSSYKLLISEADRGFFNRGFGCSKKVSFSGVVLPLLEMCVCERVLCRDIVSSGEGNVVLLPRDKFA